MKNDGVNMPFSSKVPHSSPFCASDWALPSVALRLEVRQARIHSGSPPQQLSGRTSQCRPFKKLSPIHPFGYVVLLTLAGKATPHLPKSKTPCPLRPQQSFLGSVES